MKKIIFLLLFNIFPLFGQNLQNINLPAGQAGSFSFKIENSILNVFNEEGKNLFQKKFNHPSDLISDLDEDGIDEYIIIDSSIINSRSAFTLYIFNTIDSFFLTDSIYSGVTNPYIEFSEEFAGMIIITGIPEFDNFNSADVKQDYFFSPINCWNYNNSQLFLVNEELYDIFISESEGISNLIEEHYLLKDKGCKSSQEILGAIAAVYANYINAGEKSVASQLLKKYYLCEDAEDLKQKLDDLIEGNFDENGLE